MTKQEIANELKELAEKMKTIGIAMDYFGGFNSEWAEGGAELLALVAVSINGSRRLRRRF